MIPKRKEKEYSNKTHIKKSSNLIRNKTENKNKTIKFENICSEKTIEPKNKYIKEKKAKISENNNININSTPSRRRNKFKYF